MKLTYAQERELSWYVLNCTPGRPKIHHRVIAGADVYRIVPVGSKTLPEPARVVCQMTVEELLREEGVVAQVRWVLVPGAAGATHHVLEVKI